jgi:hypothetical protein
MPRVNRLRTLRLRHAVMPFVLAALALRALIPAGFMPGAVESFAFVSAICAPMNAGATERFELPADPGTHAQNHCEFCVLPLLGAPPSPATLAQTRVAPDRARSRLTAQVAARSPDRAPSARAPPA